MIAQFVMAMRPSGETPVDGGGGNREGSIGSDDHRGAVSAGVEDPGHFLAIMQIEKAAQSLPFGPVKARIFLDDA